MRPTEPRVNLPPAPSPSAPPAASSVRPAPLAQPSPRAAHRLRASLARLLQRVRNLNVTDFESGDRPPLRLEALALGVAADVGAALDDVCAHYTAARPAEGARADEILDLASIARMELSNFAAAVGRETDGPPWHRVAVCDSVLQVSRRCLRALDAMIADAEGQPRAPDDDDETATAVQIRQAYLELHRTATGDDLPDADTIRPRLRAAGSCVARMLGRPLAQSIRVHDRYAMRAFQARIREALLDPRRDDAADDRLTRLWQDLTSFTSLLLDVNKRAELRVHDRAVTEAALAALEGLAPLAPTPPEVIASLRRCEGRDPELDILVARGAPAGPLRQCLERVRGSLVEQCPRSLHASSGTWSGLI